MNDLQNADTASGPRRLWNRNFTLLWQGQFISLLGSQAFFVAVSFWVAEATESPALLGSLLMASILPGLLLTPLGGVIADRHSRVNLVIASDLIRAVVIIGAAGVHFSQAPIDAKVLAIGIAMVISGIVGAFFQPAVNAMIPDLVPTGRLAAANSATQVSAQVASIAGQALGGILYKVLGASTLILIDGLTFLLSAGSETFIRADRTRVGSRDAGASVLPQIREGMAWVGHQPGMFHFLIAAALLNFFMAPMIVLLPFYVSGHLGASVQWYGFLVASLSAGSVFGSVVAGVVPVSGRRRARTLTILFVVTPLLLSSLAATGSRFVALGLMCAAGGCSAFINVNVFAQFQRMTPTELRGRVISLVLVVAGGAAPLGMAAGGVITEASGGRVDLTFLISGTSAALIGMLLLARKEPQQFLSTETI
ncbi:MAG TPA: MFS transporter [Rhodothermales bacterium]|nr:MFS transporter [Rhodothermales bacterium]